MDDRHSHYDVIVVGAGLGGLYAVHRFRRDGLDVRCLESAAGVGGVWRHNRYPGARVDIESHDYCYYFSEDLYREWNWTERYASQPELLAYLEHVAERFDLNRHIRFDTRMEGADWRPGEKRWEVRTSTGETLTADFLVMATGNLSEARTPDFPGIDDFDGQWVMTAHWPEEPVELEGKRIGVVGTGSSGAQVIPVLADRAAELHVFQRTPNFVVPARNGAPVAEVINKVRADYATERAWMRAAGGNHVQYFLADFDSLDAEGRRSLLEQQWERGGHGMSYVFLTQGVFKEHNDVVAEFVREKIRETVKDPETAENLSPYDHPIGSRRLVIDTNYYETFNRDHVSLVDLREEPIDRITPHGIRTTAREYPLDLLVFALGFDAYVGAINATDIRNADGERPADGWQRRPLTLLGLMTKGFPNFFFLTGPGSPATLANLFAENEYHVDWVADAISHLRQRGYRTIEPTDEGQREWTAVLDKTSAPLLRRHVRNYMTHSNPDGTRYFIPYAGGLHTYIKLADEIAANGYRGFTLGQ
ncbi:flavin-containing monooxygenase [Cryptosporangium minutisporangium]|uniref:NAD(P)/FAD-dependent oxidoreductase n=1 Tax=Cryptosporangium minutisporangium TaxID=113569 RepID=A0ABP6SRL4_9ACTN